MDTIVSAVAAALFLAFVLERLIEHFVKPVLPEKFAWAVPYLALVVGILFAFAFGVDAVTPTLEQFGTKPIMAWAGVLLTGMIIGGGSNLIHDIWPDQ
jgi:protein-S-isoprenylcysteine O-methyltransferase Ste14